MKKGLFYYDAFVFIVISVASVVCLYVFMESNNYVMIIYSLFFMVWSLSLSFRKMKKSYKRLNE